MNAENFAEWKRRQGHQVIRTESCYWYDAQPGFYFYFPYHRLINPSRDEFNRILRGRPCLGVRYFTSTECVGKSSYMIVCSDKNYDILSVDAKYARRQTRRGLEKFQIRQMDLKELANHNSVNIDTLIRQGRKPEIWTEKKWELYCSTAEGLYGFEAWGAFYDQSLAAFIVAYQMEDYFTILHQSSATKYLHFYPNNALVYYLNKLKLASAEVNHVYYGPQSLDAPNSLDTFKFRMGFKKLPMKQRIIFNPYINPFINSYSHKLVHMISALKPESDTLRKAEGIIRFYLEAS